MSARQAARWKRAACPALARDSFSKSKIWRRNQGFGMYFGELRLSKPLTGGAGRMAPGCLRGRVRRDAFLVSFGHSKRLRARGAVRPALEAGGAGAPAAAEGRTGLWPCEPVGEASRVSCASRVLETLARGLRALRAALAWLAPEARDRPRIRILKRAGAVTDELRAWPATTDGHHFGVAPPLWVVWRDPKAPPCEIRIRRHARRIRQPCAARLPYTVSRPGALRRRARGKRCNPAKKIAAGELFRRDR